MRVRQSRYIPHRAAANFSRAVSYAIDIERPLNTFVTLNYGLTYCNDEAMVVAFRRLLKSFFGKWFVRHPFHTSRLSRQLTYAWMAEGRSGHHGIHWLIHVPQQMQSEFRAALPSWVQRTAGPILDGTAIHVQPASSSRRVGDYLLKGLEPKHARRFRVKPVFQDVVYGKRCGISENLGPTAIMKHTLSGGRATQLAPSA